MAHAVPESPSAQAAANAAIGARIAAAGGVGVALNGDAATPDAIGVVINKFPGNGFSDDGHGDPTVNIASTPAAVVRSSQVEVAAELGLTPSWLKNATAVILNSTSAGYVASFTARDYLTAADPLSLQVGFAVGGILMFLQAISANVETGGFLGYPLRAFGLKPAKGDASCSKFLKLLSKYFNMYVPQVLCAPSAMTLVEAVAPPIIRGEGSSDNYMIRIKFLSFVLAVKYAVSAMAAMVHESLGLGRYCKEGNFAAFFGFVAELAAIRVYAQFFAPELLPVAMTFLTAVVALVLMVAANNQAGIAESLNIVAGDAGSGCRRVRAGCSLPAWDVKVRDVAGGLDADKSGGGAGVPLLVNGHAA